jgi:homoserine O-succinyltransferase
MTADRIVDLERRPTCGEAIEIALVNNMPDQALMATRAQFARLVRAGAEGAAVRLRCYTLPSTPRSDTARRYLSQTHEEIDALYARGADAMIVTGAEPRTVSLLNEPYWGDFCRMVDWARANTLSTLWSCLAAHAAVLRLDDIRRRREGEKISGVYAFDAQPHDWAVRGASTVATPHSRYNGLARDELERCGYRISSFAEPVGVDTFWRLEPSLFVFTQGHPEYDRDTLPREYRRDVLRYLSHERDDYPRPPQGYYADDVLQQLEAIKAQAMASRRVAQGAALSAVVARAESVTDWFGDAARLYRNWLAEVAARKNQQRRTA